MLSIAYFSAFSRIISDFTRRLNCIQCGFYAASRRKGWHMQWTPPPAQVNIVMSGS